MLLGLVVSRVAVLSMDRGYERLCLMQRYFVCCVVQFIAEHTMDIDMLPFGISYYCVKIL